MVAEARLFSCQVARVGFRLRQARRLRRKRLRSDLLHPLQLGGRRLLRSFDRYYSRDGQRRKGRRGGPRKRLRRSGSKQGQLKCCRNQLHCCLPHFLGDQATPQRSSCSH